MDVDGSPSSPSPLDSPTPATPKPHSKPEGLSVSSSTEGESVAATLCSSGKEVVADEAEGSSFRFVRPEVLHFVSDRQKAKRQAANTARADKLHKSILALDPDSFIASAKSHRLRKEHEFTRRTSTGFNILPNDTTAWTPTPTPHGLTTLLSRTPSFEMSEGIALTAENLAAREIPGVSADRVDRWGEEVGGGGIRFSEEDDLVLPGEPKGGSVRLHESVAGLLQKGCPLGLTEAEWLGKLAEVQRTLDEHQEAISQHNAAAQCSLIQGAEDYEDLKRMEINTSLRNHLLYNADNRPIFPKNFQYKNHNEYLKSRLHLYIEDAVVRKRVGKRMLLEFAEDERAYSQAQTLRVPHENRRGVSTSAPRRSIAAPPRTDPEEEEEEVLPQKTVADLFPKHQKKVEKPVFSVTLLDALIKRREERYQTENVNKTLNAVSLLLQRRGRGECSRTEVTSDPSRSRPGTASSPTLLLDSAPDVNLFVNNVLREVSLEERAAARKGFLRSPDMHSTTANIPSFPARLVRLGDGVVVAHGVSPTKQASLVRPTLIKSHEAILQQTFATHFGSAIQSLRPTKQSLPNEIDTFPIMTLHGEALPVVASIALPQYSVDVTELRSCTRPHYPSPTDSEDETIEGCRVLGKQRERRAFLKRLFAEENPADKVIGESGGMIGSPAASPKKGAAPLKKLGEVGAPLNRRTSQMCPVQAGKGGGGGGVKRQSQRRREGDLKMFLARCPARRDGAVGGGGGGGGGVGSVKAVVGAVKAQQDSALLLVRERQWRRMRAERGGVAA